MSDSASKRATWQSKRREKTQKITQNVSQLINSLSTRDHAFGHAFRSFCLRLPVNDDNSLCHIGELNQ
jgi:hypothetical protein